MSPSSEILFSKRWGIAEAVELALVLEATAPKAGNVHPAAAFADMEFTHFLASAVIAGRAFATLDAEPHQSAGALILRSVQAVHAAVGKNTILGSLLLFGPLAKAYSDSSVCSRDAIQHVLQGLTPADSQTVYQAIRLAQPGGIGQRDTHDVRDPAPDNLLEAMSLVAQIDAVARQYTQAFEDIFERCIPWLAEEVELAEDILDAICRLQLRWLAYEPDGLIFRKAGAAAAYDVQVAAQRTQDACRTRAGRLAEQDAFRQFDTLLRADGHRLNPGTTADLIAATLLAKLLT